MHEGLTVVQTAQVLGELHWAVTRLFAVSGVWASEADRPDIAVSMATSSRHLGWHATDLETLFPDSVLLADEAVSRPAGHEIVDALDAIEATAGSLERLAVLYRVLLSRLAAHCVAVERSTAAHADAPLTRILGFLLADIRRDRDDGEACLTRLLADVDLVDRVNAAVVECERRLVTAGGLLQLRLD